MALGNMQWTEAAWSVDFSKMSQGIPVAGESIAPAFSSLSQTRGVFLLTCTFFSLALAAPGFGAAKDAGELVVNMDRAPVAIIDGKHALGQSKTIERYLARRLGLLGGDEVEAAHIDLVVEHIRDIKDKYTKAKGEKDKETAVAKYFAETMPEFMGKLEKAVVSTGRNKGPPLIGKSLSHADVSLYVFLLDFFDDKKGAMASISACPCLQASVKAVAEHPGVSKYRASRTGQAT